MSVQGGFDRNTNNQSAQKGAQDKIEKVVLPVNCHIVNYLKQNEKSLPSTQQHFELDSTPFEMAVMVGMYQLVDNHGQSKFEGILVDHTGSISVSIEKPKDTDEYPDFLQKYLQEVQRNGGDKKVYVRALIRVKKQRPTILVKFSIVVDFNEISRHNLEIIVRHLQRTNGLDYFAQPTHTNTNQTADRGDVSTKLMALKVDDKLPPEQQILQYFRERAKITSINNQVQKQEVASFFREKKLNAAQVSQYLNQLVSQNEIMHLETTDAYFLAQY